VTPRQRFRRNVGAQRELLRRGGLARTLRLTVPVDPSRLQLAIELAADGILIPQDLLSDEEVEKYFGCDRVKLALCRPVIVVIVAGVRGGKTMLASNAAIHSAMVAECDEKLLPQQLARVAIVGPRKRNAEAAFEQVTGALHYSSGLRSMLVSEPVTSPTHLVKLRRPDGRRVNIEIAAADQGGLSVRSGYLAGFVLDEVALLGESGAGDAVNAEEVYHAAETRLLPRAQGWVISSPYGPRGLLYQLFSDHFGKPGRVLVVRAPTLALNPTFDPELVEAVRRENPDVAAREYDAEWVDADSAFFEGLLIDSAARSLPLEHLPAGGARYIATMDQAMRGNAWTLVVARDKRKPSDAVAEIEVALAREWVGSRAKPLDSKVVLEAIKEVIAPFGLRAVNCDSYAIDPLKTVATGVGLVLREHNTTGELTLERYRSVDSLLRQSRLELPPHDGVKRDLRAVRKKASAKGITVDLPTTSDGRHCDFAPSVALAVWLLARRSGGGGMIRAMSALQQRGGPGSLFR
jgi:hypothetical protein